MHKDSRLLPKGRAVGLGVLKRVLLIVLALAVASIFLAVSGYDPLAILKGLAQSMTQDLAGTIRWSTAMILAGLFPPIGNFFASLPQSVLGGCTIMMFGTILTSGMQMIANCGFTQRNITIVAMALSIGIGFTTTSESGIWAGFSPVVQSVFSANVVAVVFVVAIIMNLILPKNMEVEKLDK